MSLDDPSQMENIPLKNSFRLGASDLIERQLRYDQGYPGHAFDPRTIRTGK